MVVQVREGLRLLTSYDATPGPATNTTGPSRVLVATAVPAERDAVARALAEHPGTGVDVLAVGVGDRKSVV